MIVNFATPLAEDGAMPGEIDRFLTALRAEPSILRHFPNIEVSGLHADTSTASKAPKVAQYSVVCLPKTELVKGRTAPGERRNRQPVPVPRGASTMSEKNSGSSLERLVLTQLRDPIRLRFAPALDPSSPPGTSDSTARRATRWPGPSALTEASGSAP